MMKKMLTVALLVLHALAECVAGTRTIDDVRYYYSSNYDYYYAMVEGYRGSAESVAIPSTITINVGSSPYPVYHTYSVKSINANAFVGCRSLTSVTIPDSVTSIGNGAFSGCSSLTSVTIPDSVTSIGDYTFYNCSGLTSVTIPDRVTSIGKSAFYNCSGLTSVTIPNRVTSIGDRAFTWCSGLTSVTIPNSVSRIEHAAFCNCRELAIVHFRGAPPIVDSSAFGNVKSDAIGTYTAEHSAAWEAVIGTDGKWNGLIMQMAKPPTLSVESADWTDGTITLRCEDSDDSGAEHEYYLSYYETIEEVKKWYDIDGATRIKASREIDSNGNSKLVARLTDARFAKRNMGLGTVRYRVSDENGRTAECETRKRHGLFVAIDLYENRPNIGLVESPSPTQAAAAFRGAYARHGDAAGYLWTLENWDAKKNAIIDQVVYIADNYSRPGDVFLFYYAGHGYNGGVACYDFEKYLSARELSQSFKRFPSGVGVVAIINACHSASMIDMGDVAESVQVGWIASSQESENTKAGVFDSIVCDRGWLKGGADYNDPTGAAGGNGDGYVTFGELALWGQQLAGKTYYRYRMLTDLKNYRMLDNVVAGRVPSHASVTPLTDGPSTLTAIPGNSGEIRLSWAAVSGASGYDIYRKLRSEMPNTYVYVGAVKGTSARDGSSYALTPNVEYEYYVRAVNDVYVSDASPTASCAPSENVEIRDYVSRFMSAMSTSSIDYSEHPPIVNGELDYSNLNYDHDGDGMTTFEEYVAGTNPADEADRFVASIKIEDGRPSVSWSPNLNTNGSERIYTVWGKTNLFDEVGWTSPTNSGHRFFKVDVEMP